MIQSSAMIAGNQYPLNVAQEVNGRVLGLRNQEELFSAEALQNPEIDIQLIRRADTLPAKGIVRTALEYDISLIVIGWQGRPTFRQSIFGTLLDEVIWNAPAPVLIGWMTTPINGFQRIVLVIPPNSMALSLPQDRCEYFIIHEFTPLIGYYSYLDNVRLSLNLHLAPLTQATGS